MSASLSRASRLVARARPKARMWLRASLRAWRQPQRWRLASGLVLFSFVLTHFLNHALGHVSLDVMERVQDWRTAVWRSVPGTALLGGAALVHVSLALAKLVGRRSWRMAPWEAAQLLLGLAIPVLLVAHVMVSRGLYTVTGLDDSYTTKLRLLWPAFGWKQSLLLLVVWGHACIGLNYWLATKSWYERWWPAFLVAAVLVPTLALTGWIEAGRRVATELFDAPPLTEAQVSTGGQLIALGERVVWSVLGGAVVLALALRLVRRLRGGPRITYADGRTVRAASGATLLEISRSAGIPHAAVCGGRGRCTTCRVQVMQGGAELPAPNAVEAAALARIGAPAGIRLACQVRPTQALTVRPLIPLKEASPALTDDGYRWGVERRITVLFADLRGFTTLAERLYPYDAVFLLNRYFEVMSEAVRRNGGEVDKFLGDGIMALFGLEPARGAGSRDGLFAARDMLVALDRLNAEFDATLNERLRMGIGLHMGPAILGRVGGGRPAGLTALGDTVNVASRLEALNKEFGSVLVVSQAALAASGLAIEGAATREIPVRGREGLLTVAAADSLDGLHEAEGARRDAEAA